MTSFRPAIGHLCLNEKVDIVPMYLGGTHDALPVGAALPKQRRLWVKIGDPIRADRMSKETEAMSRSAAYRHVAEKVEAAVRALGGLEPVTFPDEDEIRRARRAVRAKVVTKSEREERVAGHPVHGPTES